jgi:hypothetical protein
MTYLQLLNRKILISTKGGYSRLRAPTFGGEDDEDEAEDRA